MPDAVELGLCHLGQVGQAVHRRDARAPLEVGREGLTQEKGLRRHRHPAGRLQPVGPQRAPAQQERSTLATPQRLGHLVNGVGRHHGGAPSWPGRAGTRGRLRPGRVSRQDQRGHAARRPERGGHGVGAVGGHVISARRRAVPPRHRPGDGRDVRLQGGVVAGVVRRMVAHDVDDRRPGPPRVVEIGQPVAEARSEMQQRGRWAPGDAPVPVGGTGDDSLEEAEDAPHGGHVVQRCDKVHLRGARIGEADVDAGIDERRDERACAVHDDAPVRATPSSRSGLRMPAGSKARLMERISSSDTGSCSSRK